ncbi:MAG: hypothetical protein WD793_10835 [Steroidobacteraceae bacterium]
MLDLERFTAGLVDTIKRAIAPLAERLQRLEAFRQEVDGCRVDTAERFATLHHKLDELAERLEGAQTKSLADAYRGAWLPGRFERGALVTHDGSLWLAIEDGNGKPGQSATWRLIIKSARGA